MEVFGRYLVHPGIGSSIPGAQIRRLVGKDIRGRPATRQRELYQ